MISYKTEEITPQIAMVMLEGNTHNRDLSQRQIEKWALAMKRGEWELNGEAIMFNGHDVLNGRLSKSELTEDLGGCGYDSVDWQRRLFFLSRIFQHLLLLRRAAWPNLLQC